MKRYLVLFLSAVIALSSCNDEYVYGTYYEGNAFNALSEGTKAYLDAIELPSGTSLVVRVDSICPKNDYLDRVQVSGNSFVIQAYLEPRLIKADVYGAAGSELTGARGNEYLARQISYARGASVDNSVISMSEFLLDVHAEASDKYSKRTNRFGASGFKSFIDDLTFGFLFLVKPYYNFWGSLMKPFYLLGASCISATGSVVSALVMLTFILAVAMSFFFFSGAFIARRGKRTLGMIVASLADLTNLIAVFSLLIASLFLVMPRYENIIVLQERYGYDNASALIDAYASHSFTPSGVWLIVLAMVLYVIFTIMKSFALPVQRNYTEEQAEQAASDAGNALGEQLVSMVPLLLCAVVIDKMFVLAFILFYLLKIMLKVYGWRASRGDRWIWARPGKIVLYVALIGVVGCFLFAAGESEKDESDLFSPSEYAFARNIFSEGQIDTVSYLMGVVAMRQVKSDPGLSGAEIDVRAYWNGMSQQMRNPIAVNSRWDTLSYRAGREFGAYLKSNHYASGAGELDYENFARGFEDCKTVSGVDHSFASRLMRNWTDKRDAYISSRNKADAKTFLENISSMENMKKSRSGMRYVIYESGTGRKARTSSTVTMAYTCYLTDGTIFEESEGAEFKVSKLVPGWREGVCLLATGGHATFVVPSNLGYGSRWHDILEPNSMLIYKVKILKVK